MPDDPEAPATKPTPRKPSSRPKRKKSLYQRLAFPVRWLHTYVSLIAFASLMFFAFTGLTLNHPDWFGGDNEKYSEYEGQVDLAWLGEANETDQDAGAASVARLEIAEYLRSEHRLRGAVTDFEVDEYECIVIFKGPGYSADAYIDRNDGNYTVSESALGWVAIINDLHKGRDSGETWSWFIDVSAIVTVLLSLTGIILLLWLKKRRTPGLLTALVGTILMVVVYWYGVP